MRIFGRIKFPASSVLPDSPLGIALLAAAAGLAILVRGIFQLVTQVTFEDALISLRYAENLAAGHGMVYNVGERVFGASTPLYVLYLAGLSWLGLPALAVAKGTSALADGATLFLWARWLWRYSGKPWVAAAWALLFGLAPLMVHVSVSGMETSYALLLLTLALLADAEERPLACGGWLGLLMLVRPDGALAAALILGMRWWRTGKLPWRSALLAAALVLPWLLAATWYYGTPLPNSIPAKAAAYNLHRPSIGPGLRGTWAQFAPLSGTVGQLLTTAVLAPLLVLGVVAAWRDGRLRTLPVLFAAWWAYLVLPRTVIFVWYFPLLLLPAYLLSVLGFSALDGRFAQTEPGSRLRWRNGTVALLGVGLVSWLCWAGCGARRIQRAEEGVRRSIGIWLREQTPAGARVAMEPIGYIGYYSQRRILDVVGLVSPEMIPLNRVGDGWFPKMLRQFQPEYVVERPVYLLFNRTLNSGVQMFTRAEEREAFVAEYEPVAAFASIDVPQSLRKDYEFVIYRRRSEERRREWQRSWDAWSTSERRERMIRVIIGEAVPAKDGPG